MTLKIKQPLAKLALGGEERGLSLKDAGDVRVVVHAPAGQTLGGGFTIHLALRHAATGLVLPISGGDVVIPAAEALASRGVVAADLPARGNEGDELIVWIAGGSTSGTPLDVEDAGFIYLVLEPIPAR